VAIVVSYTFGNDPLPQSRSGSNPKPLIKFLSFISRLKA
jgi:hypothetical protein